MKINFTSNGRARGLGKIRSIFDFFFPYPDRDAKGVGIIRAEHCAASLGAGKGQSNEFFTFRAFAIHYAHVLCIFPFRKALRGQISPSLAWSLAVVAIALFNKKLLPFQIAWPLISIAYDTEADATGSGAATAVITTAGTNQLVVCLADNSTDTSGVNTPTLDLSNMTAVDSIARISSSGAFYYTVGTSAAAHTVVETKATKTCFVIVTSYSGCKQTGVPDAHTTASGVCDKTFSLTTVADQCWMIINAGNDQVATTITSGATQRKQTSSMVADTNGALSAGSNSIVIGDGGAHSHTTYGMIFSFAPVPGTNYTQTLSETLSLADTLLKLPSRTLSEVLALVDSSIKMAQRIFTETLSLTDSITKTKIQSKTLSDVLSLTDSTVRTIQRTLSETLALVDSILRTMLRTLSDTLSLTDSIANALAHTKTLTETLQIKDWLFINGNLIRNIWTFVSKNVSNTWTQVSKNVSNIWKLQDKS